MTLGMKLAIAALEIVAALFAMHRWKAKRGEDFALSAPAPGPLIVWVGLFATWMLASNFVALARPLGLRTVATGISSS